MINSVGVIDGDYYGNPGNEGHIFAQMQNITDQEVVLEEEDRIVQAVLRRSCLLIMMKQMVCGQVVLEALGIKKEESIIAKKKRHCLSNCEYHSQVFRALS